MPYGIVCHMANAAKVLHRRFVNDDLLVEIVLWRLPRPTAERTHRIKYRLYCGRSGVTVVRYDNETGKGDHRHYGENEQPYAFTSVGQLLADFAADVERLTGWRFK